MEDFIQETKAVISVYLKDPTPNIEHVMRVRILHLGKSDSRGLFALNDYLVNCWNSMPAPLSGEVGRRRVVLGCISDTIESERLCHMCHNGRFAFMRTVGDGIYAKDHYLCSNDTCGAMTSENAYNAPVVDY